MFRQSSPILAPLVAAFLKTTSHGVLLKFGSQRNACNSFSFRPRETAKAEAVMRFPGWRYVHQEGWTGAVTEHSGVCFMAAVRGGDKDLQPYLSQPARQLARRSARSERNARVAQW